MTVREYLEQHPGKKLPELCLQIENEDITIDVISAGYEWMCPWCDRLNHEIEYTEEVICDTCIRRYETAPPEHAIGA